MGKTYKKKAPVAKEVTKEELQVLQEFVQKINNGTVQVGNLETQKHQVLHALTMVQADLKDFQVGLKEKYGEANIDVRTGKIEYNLEK
jgi:hypothetical protein|tara:strand:- start:804 stop:1067 length:264 start_codon:yes stop_codon:yes gene_type:complete